MDHRSTPRPHLWRKYVEALLPDATAEPSAVTAPWVDQRRRRDRRLRRDRARHAHRLARRVS